MRLELDEGYKEGRTEPIIIDNQGIDDYYFIQDKEEVQRFIQHVNNTILDLEKQVNEWQTMYKQKLADANYYRNCCIELSEDNEMLRTLLEYADRLSEIGRSYVQDNCSPDKVMRYTKRIDNVIYNQVKEELGKDYLTLYIYQVYHKRHLEEGGEK